MQGAFLMLFFSFAAVKYKKKSIGLVNALGAKEQPPGWLMSPNQLYYMPFLQKGQHVRFVKHLTYGKVLFNAVFQLFSC